MDRIASRLKQFFTRSCIPNIAHGMVCQEVSYNQLPPFLHLSLQKGSLMESQTIFAALRDVFAELYPQEADARVVVADAGLEINQIAFHSRAQTNWHNIVTEAVRQSCLDRLLAIVQANYKDYQPLQAAAVIYQQFVEQYGQLSLPGLEDPAPGESPYKGMEYFDVADADRFFGREQLTTELVAALTPVSPLTTRQGGGNLLAVVGASGSGKSSLVRAGVIPALKGTKQLMDGAKPPAGSARWLNHIITPTAHPLKALAGSLTRDSESVRAQAVLMDDLNSESRTLDLYAHRLVQSGNRLLLVVDQFEELFTLCKERSERQAFVDNLLMAANPDGAVTLILTLRADFYHYCAEFPELRAALETRQKYIGAMSKAELRRAIQEPARLGQWQLQAGLVEQMLQDVGDEPGALPLLSHALLETWKRRSGRMLTLAGYQLAGGVQGAIAKTADDTFLAFAPNQQAIARTIFLRLTELGNDAQDTRRHVHPDELTLSNASREEVSYVLKILTDVRLVTTDANKVQVAHEALIRAWQMLRDWLADDRAGLLILHRLGEAAAAWELNDKADGYLYRGLPLQQASAWVSENTDRLNTREQSFLYASQQAEASDRAEREDIRRREADQRAQLAAEQARASEQARLNSRLLRLRNGLVVLALIIAVIAGIAFQQSRVAKHQTVVAETARIETTHLNQLVQADLIVANSVRLVDTAPQNALLIAAEASQLILDQGADHAPSLISAETDFRRLLQQVGGIPLRAYEAPFFPRLFSRGATLALSAKGTWLASGSDEKVWLWLLANPNTPRVLRHHTSPVFTLAFSPDEQWLASAGRDQMIQLWHIDNVEAEPKTLTGHEGPVTALAFSPNGQWLASGSADTTVRLWSMAQPITATYRLAQHEHRINTLAFSPDGRWLASGDDGGQLRMWSMADSTATPYRLEGHEQRIVMLAFSPDGQWLASASADATIRLWRVDESGAAPIVLDQHTAPVWAVAFSPDGRWLASGSRDRTVRLWDLQDPTALPRILTPNHIDNVSALAFSPNSQWLASASWDQRVHLWDMRNPAAEGRVLRGHEFQILALAFTTDSRSLISAGKDQIVRLWEVANPFTEPRILTDHAAEISTVAFSPNQQWLASAGTDGAIHLRNPANLEETRVLTGHNDVVTAITFSPAGTWLASASWDGTARLWDLTSPGPTSIFTLEHPSAVHTVAFSPDGQWLASGSGGPNGDNALRLWNMANPVTATKILTDHLGTISAVTFSPDGLWLAAGDDFRSADSQRQGRVWLWEVADLSHVYMVKADDFAVRNVVFSPDSRSLASGGLDWLVKVWDVPKLTNPQILSGHIATIYGMAFSTDGRWLASTGFERTIHLWDMKNLVVEPRILYGHTDTVSSLVFSPDGRWLASGGADKSVRLWTASLTALIEKACLTAGRNLTHEEWQRFFPERTYHQTCQQWPEES